MLSSCCEENIFLRNYLHGKLDTKWMSSFAVFNLKLLHSQHRKTILTGYINHIFIAFQKFYYSSRFYFICR